MAFDYGNKKENGQYENYPTHTEGGYVAPIRRTYVHRKCGVATKISEGIAETYAKNPRYYGSTFCVGCRDHFPINQFHWDDGVTLGEIGVAWPRPKLLSRTKTTQEYVSYVYENPEQAEYHVGEMSKNGWVIDEVAEAGNGPHIRYLRVTEEG